MRRKKRCIPPKQRRMEFQNKEEAGCASTRCSPSRHLLKQLQALREDKEPHLLSRTYSRQVLCCAQPHRVRRPSSTQLRCGCGNPLVLLGGQRKGSWLLPSLVPLKRLCLTNLSPPPPKLWVPSGGLKALMGVLGDPQDNCLPLGSGWVHRWAHYPILSPDPGAGTQEEVCHSRKKPLGLSQLCRRF